VETATNGIWEQRMRGSSGRNELSDQRWRSDGDVYTKPSRWCHLRIEWEFRDSGIVHSRLVVAPVVSGLTLTHSVRAQSIATAPALVTTHGLAYDSLRGAPLEGAFIGLAGSTRTAISNSHGEFCFDSLAPGVHTLTMQHAALDSIGFYGTSTRLTVRDNGVHTVIVFVPSFRTLWAVACGTPAPAGPVADRVGLSSSGQRDRSRKTSPTDAPGDSLPAGDS
jgi:hypothetical protein